MSNPKRFENNAYIRSDNENKPLHFEDGLRRKSRVRFIRRNGLLFRIIIKERKRRYVINGSSNLTIVDELLTNRRPKRTAKHILRI